MKKIVRIMNDIINKPIVGKFTLIGLFITFIYVVYFL